MPQLTITISLSDQLTDEYNTNNNIYTNYSYNTNINNPIKSFGENRSTSLSGPRYLELRFTEKSNKYYIVDHSTRTTFWVFTITKSDDNTILTNNISNETKKCILIDTDQTQTELSCVKYNHHQIINKIIKFHIDGWYIVTSDNDYLPIFIENETHIYCPITHQLFLKCE